MKVHDHNGQTLEKWRDGVMTKMRTSALSGSHQLCIFDQWCEKGLGAPIHLHAVEEVLEVFEGTAEIWLGDKKAIVVADQSVLIPAGCKHGFRNVGEGILHVRATLASSIFEATYESNVEQSRRWIPTF